MANAGAPFCSVRRFVLSANGDAVVESAENDEKTLDAAWRMWYDVIGRKAARFLWKIGIRGKFFYFIEMEGIIDAN